jgi:hypothetical protein
MESIERSKAGNNAWNEKKGKLEYTMMLLSQYDSITKSYTWMTDEMIKKMFPDMQSFIDMKDSTNS